MREIKFRGKRMYSDEWVYGYYIKTQHCSPPKEKEMCFMHWIVDRGGIKLRVIPETVGQYIESKDIEGNEIYEGDKIRWYPNKPKNHIDNVVECVGNKFSLGDWYEDDYPNTEGQCKIIGNIFDNPELRGGKS